MKILKINNETHKVSIQHSSGEIITTTFPKHIHNNKEAKFAHLKILHDNHKPKKQVIALKQETVKENNLHLIIIIIQSILLAGFLIKAFL